MKMVSARAICTFLAVGCVSRWAQGQTLSGSFDILTYNVAGLPGMYHIPPYMFLILISPQNRFLAATQKSTHPSSHNDWAITPSYTSRKTSPTTPSSYPPTRTSTGHLTAVMSPSATD